MTMTLEQAETPVFSWRLARNSSVPLAQQLADKVAEQIGQRALRVGARLPSIRDMAALAAVSRFTVVEAYELLVAHGLIQSRRGAGFYVQAPALSADSAQAPAMPSARAGLDVSWLLRSMFQEAPAGDVLPGSSGMLPAAWTDPDMLSAAMRRLGRLPTGYLLHYGVPEGYLPLRQQVARILQRDGVELNPASNLMTTGGVTHALGLVTRYLARPGDTVLVEDPSWFVGFANIAAQGIRPIGVPRSVRGLDLARLEELAQVHKPRFFLCNSVVHNPTGNVMTARMAHEILRLAERYDFMVVEDDTYGDLSSGTPVRLAALDSFKRVILVGGFSKLMAANLRVGYLAAAPEHVAALCDLKMLSGLSSPEMGERLVYSVLAGGQYRRHVLRAREKTDTARRVSHERLRALGLGPGDLPDAGLFLWTDCGVDAERLAMAAADQGLLLAPGSLFSPAQQPSTHIRFSISLMQDEKAWPRLSHALAVARG